MQAHDNKVLDALGPLMEAGFALHWLHPKTKRPIGDDWSTKPVASVETLRRRHATGNNLGVRLGEVSKMAAGGYLHCLDVDIRDSALAAVAWARLAELLPEVDLATFPTVQSGSGGESRHVYFITDAPFASKKIAKSVGSKMVFDPAKGRDVKKHDWEIEVFGYPKQVVLPPSIHPDTGQPYIWLRPFDFDMLALGAGPFVPSAAIERVGGIDNSQENAEPGELKPKLGLTVPEAKAILAELPLDEWCEDRDGWLQTGMALHHEFGEDGFAIWTEFSKQSAKFDDKNQLAVWKSFRAKPNSVRMATLKGAAATARLQTMFDEVDDEEEGGEDPEIEALIGAAAVETDEFDDILGEAMAPSTSLQKGLTWADLVMLLEVNEEGGIKSTLHNLEMIVKNDPRLVGLPQLNEFTQETVQRTPPGRKASRRRNSSKETRQLGGRVWDVRDTLNGELWSDDRDFAIRSILEAPKTQGGYGIQVTDRNLKASVVLAANENAFHPVREYLDGLEWDGTPRAERIFVDYLGAPDDAYSRNVGRLMMVGAVTRIFEPGHKFDFAVILEGLQGKRKSTFIQILGRNWFAELDGDFHDPKQMVELMQGAWIMEIPELSGFSRADVRSIKAFISRQRDRARLAYARRAGEFPRQCIFIGSTNDSEYLKDDTGGRRFWPMRCNVAEIPTDRLARNVDQLWAEAVTIYREMRAAQPYGTLPLYLMEESARVTAARLQESRRVENADDALAGRIATWLDKPISDGGYDDVDENRAPRYRNETCLIELWVEALGGDSRAFDNAKSNMLSRAMKLVDGWTGDGTQKRFANWGKQRAYYRGGEAGKNSRLGIDSGILA